MFLFPIIYIISFVYAITLLLKKEIKGFYIFIAIGLPVYINALSVTYLYGFEKAIPVMQAFKEISLVFAFFLVILQFKKRPKLILIDKLILLFFIYSLLYLFLPIGEYNFFNRLIAFKALSVFPVIYFTGRFCKIDNINIDQFFSYICAVIIAAAFVLLFEVIPYQHLHTHTGLTNFMVHFYNAQAGGSYGLLYSFETESGLKRFGSIFSSPLELSAASILTLSILLGLITSKSNRIKFTNFYILTFFATLFCVLFAVSRAAFVNYFLLIYCYAHITHNKQIIKYFHYFVLLIGIYFAFFLKGNLYDDIVATLSFENSSSIGHVLEWINGINAMITHPFGMGLGASGRVSMETNDNIGGESQLIIIGVQVGVAMIIVYIWSYALLIKTGLQSLKTASGKKKKLILATVLLKIGFIIPLITSYFDSFIYITFASYFLSGLMINMIVTDAEPPKEYQPVSLA